LSEYLSYNKNYLCKVFKNTTTFTIKDYVYYLRIQKAVELICQTDFKLIEVSERVGFKNIYHFNRVFKKITSYTPGEVRRQEKDGLYSDIQAHGQFYYRYFEKD
ncbi:MAG: AraC family transcriptional regulator, partial [Sphingobacteriia bacterium]|nr:AraC family transcriptional regulator [Sphingobacteriia bacterium]